MRYRFETVTLASIDFGDDTHRISTARNNTDLVASIKNVGVLNPPLLLENNSEYTIICGFRRIEACRTLDCSHVEARILQPGATKVDCAKFAVADNALPRPLNLIETSRSIRLLSGFIDDEDMLARELSALGLPENQSLIKKIGRLCHLPRRIQRAILSDTVSLAMALELAALTPEAGSGFVEFFETLTLSLNKQREVLTLVQEIALREDIAILEVLNDHGLQEILNHSDLDKNQKTRIIRSDLKKRRFPAVTNAERAFEQLIKELKLPNGIKLIPPPNFEGSKYTLTFNFKKLLELKDHKATFETIIQNPYMEKILG